MDSVQKPFVCFRHLRPTSPGDGAAQTTAQASGDGAAAGCAWQHGAKPAAPLAAALQRAPVLFSKHSIGRVACVACPP